MRLRAFVEGAVGEKPSDRGRGWLDQIGPVRVRCGVPSGPGVLMTGCVASYAEEEDADSRSAWVGGAPSGGGSATPVSRVDPRVETMNSPWVEELSLRLAGAPAAVLPGTPPARKYAW